MLYRVVYHSRSALEAWPQTTETHVGAILAAASDNNRRAGITGGLIYDRHWFAQTLEGDEGAVTALYDHIAVDPRHQDLVVVQSGPAESRRFPGCPMAAACWKKAKGSPFSLTEGSFDPRTLARDALLDLLDALVHHQNEQQEGPAWTTRNALNRE